ncbi:hypothetical protein Syun_030069 [Stephania yunnanensis]|uniref:Uncharacterized protein n=1 Tax=Stephania yunnanensis TaxID=152371 RepID=A0AAP0HLY7_9MAGN
MLYKMRGLRRKKSSRNSPAIALVFIFHYCKVKVVFTSSYPLGYLPTLARLVFSANVETCHVPEVAGSAEPLLGKLAGAHVHRSVAAAKPAIHHLSSPLHHGGSVG